jgi:Asp-tRNA(Asn)/Glu-tRNA(Gln) amidotransferase A subunit family amidase
MVVPEELGVREAAEAIHSGALTAQALAEVLLARCAAGAPLNAFISLEPDRVRAEARRADQQRQRGDRLGPLHGVPLVLKDNIDTADYPTTAGTPGLAAHCPKRNAPIVQQLLDAGALILGKANLQELAYGPTSNNAAFGPRAQSLRPDPHSGRLERRNGSRGRRPACARRAGHRYGRLGPRSRVALRCHQLPPNHVALAAGRHRADLAYP